MATRCIIFIFLLDTPQCATACGVFLWPAAALILSFSSTFLL
ncbi:putative membrane protein [Pseudomonas aeruginosa]|nr:putative membrane protein [Pseudomonas aeruginosa]